MINRSEPKFDPCRTPDPINITQSPWVQLKDKARQVITCSKLTIETVEQGVKHVQSWQ